MLKIAWHWGSFTVTWYGLLVAAGFFFGLWNASRRAPRAGLSGDTVFDLGPWLVIGAILGSRIHYVLANWDYFTHQRWWEVFMVHHGGLIFYGGLVGAVSGGVIFVLWRRLSYWNLADVLAPGIALGHAIGRVGCLTYGCCYGRSTSLPWAIHFPADHETAGALVHPTQLYEAALNLVLFGLLSWLFSRRKFPGQVFAWYLAGYALVRSTVELFRGDYAHYVAGWITPAHGASAVILLAGMALLWWLPRRKSGAVQPPTG